MQNIKNRRNCKVLVLFTCSTYIFLVLCVELYVLGFLKSFETFKMKSSVRVQELVENEQEINDIEMNKLNEFFNEDYDHLDDINDLNNTSNLSGAILFSDETEQVKDWHDYKFIKYEANRTGPGEQGKPYNLNGKEIKENEALLEIYGFYPLVSDRISVNRSVPDVRDPKCHDMQYFSELPSASVIVIFRNELASVLLRTIHSILNRTPPELLHEIIIVNDLSDRAKYPELYEPLQKYAEENFPKKVKIINLTQRKGLILTRIEGAKIATGDVLVFFDSHLEVNVNWLPPLLEPIKKNRRVATVPIVDYFDWKTFQYFKVGDGSRGIIDWELKYHKLPKFKENQNSVTPHATPIMLGCAFAINREFFWEIGAYDEELRIWNGEHYEISFKLWLCGDGMYEVPCSRVVHTFRGAHPGRIMDFKDILRNWKRVVEVWMEDYKNVVYERLPKLLDIDAGNLLKVMEIRDKCKPFKYFLEKVAPDTLTYYPLCLDCNQFASGTIKSLANPKVCLDTYQRPLQKPLGLYECDKNLTYPKLEQSFVLNFQKQLQRNNSDSCVDASNVILFDCIFYNHTNQYWEYDLANKQLRSGSNSGKNCITANLTDNSLFMGPCNITDLHQKWEFGFVNQTAMQNWDNINEFAIDFELN